LTLDNKYLAAFFSFIALIVKHRTLILEMARRELTERYSGQMLGIFWTIFHPLFMMALYIFIFVIVFKTKIQNNLLMPLDYTAYLLAGLIPWLGLQESLSKACAAITSNANLVKQVMFPIEILPIKTVLTTTFTQLVSSVLLILYILFYQSTFWVTFLLVPVLILLQIMMMIGLGCILASFGVFFRDLKDFIQLFCIAGAYIMPVFYLPEWAPSQFKVVIYSNPFSYMIWCYQDAIYYGRFEHPIAWLVFPILSISLFIIGYKVLQRLKPIMGDSL
jgi:lipopolysaccharide transport system permease protein